MLQRNEINSILKIALPLMAAFLAQKGMQLIDIFMMGGISNQALAAGALATSVYITVLVFCMGTLSAVGVYIAKHRGANQYENIPFTLQNGVFLALFLAIPGMVLIWNTPWFLLKIGEDPHIVIYSKIFLHAIVWGFPGIVLYLLFREFIAAFSLTRVVMLVTFCSLPLTFALNYIFIYGKLGLPAFGIAGIGYASAIIMWLMFFSLWFFSTRSSELKNYTISSSKINFEVPQIKAFLTMGIPSGFIMVLDSGMFAVATLLMGYLGTNFLAAHQVAMQCGSVAFSAPFALCMATALLVGHSVGANNLAQAKRYTYLSLGIGLIFAIFIGLVFLLFSAQLGALFLNPDEVHYNAAIKLITSFLTIAVFFQFFDALQTILTGALRGLKDTFVPMLICMACYWILGIGCAYYLAFHTSFGAKGIWYGLTFAICSNASILVMRTVMMFRKFERTNLSSASNYPLSEKLTTCT